MFTPTGPLDTHVIFNGEIITSVKYAVHLGNTIGYVEKGAAVRKYTGEFFGRVNLLMSQFGYTNEFIIYKLFKTYCMPLYGCNYGT